MKGNLSNPFKINGLENKNTGFYLWASPGIHPRLENHFFGVEQEEQSPEQAEEEGTGLSFLAASLYPLER